MTWKKALRHIYGVRSIYNIVNVCNMITKSSNLTLNSFIQNLHRGNNQMRLIVIDKDNSVIEISMSLDFVGCIRQYCIKLLLF